MDILYCDFESFISSPSADFKEFLWSLPCRAKKLIERRSCKSMSDVMALPVEELFLTRGIGTSSVYAIHEELKKRGFAGLRGLAPLAPKAILNFTKPGRASKKPAKPGRSAKEITNPNEVAMIMSRYKGNGGSLSYTEIEDKFGLRPTNGMTAYRIIQKNQIKVQKEKTYRIFPKRNRNTQGITVKDLSVDMLREIVKAREQEGLSLVAIERRFWLRKQKGARASEALRKAKALGVS